MIYDLRINGAENCCFADRTAVFSWKTDFRTESFSVLLEGGDTKAGEEVSSPVCRYDYKGKLRPLTDYTFTVTCYAAGRRESASLRFRTALVNGFPEKCKWIGDEKIPGNEQNFGGNPATVLFKRFDAKIGERTFLHVAGLGLFVAELNGKRIGNDVLNCPFTDYSTSVLYANYEITHLLKAQGNELKITLGDGWFNQTAKDEWNFYLAEWRDTCKAIVYIEGGTEVFSDESWLVLAPCKTVASSIRLGEVTDYTIKQFTKSRGAALRTPPEGKLKSMECNPIRETEIIPYKSAKKYDGGYIFDFGTSVTGYIALTARAANAVKIRYGDRLDENGRIDNSSNAQYVYGGEYQTDTIFGDGKEHEYRPQFTYHAFRWVEIEGLDEIPGKERLAAVFIRSAFEKTGDFYCDDKRLNELYALSMRSLECNFTGFPTDCPHREKNGWTGDMQLSADVFVKNYDVAPDLYKWLEDVAESQKESGMLPCIVPTAGWGYDWGNGPAWDFALFAVPYALYSELSDTHAIYRVYDSCEKYLRFIGNKQSDGLVNMGLGDWNYPKDGKTEVCPTELTCSCYFARMCEIFAEFSKIVGNKGNAARYENKARLVKKSVRDKYCGGDKTAKGLTELAALLYFGISDDEELFDALVRKLRESDYAAYYGILGAKYVHRVLCERGRTDIFINIMRRSDYPSFGYWLSNGATTLWEDYEGTNSRNHHMYADIAAVMQTYIAGIKTTVKDGKHKLVVEPHLCDLKSVSAKAAVTNGTAKVSFTKSDDGFFAKISVPYGIESVFIFNGKSYPLCGGENEFVLKD